MVQTLEAIKGGEGSIKVGMTGTIGALMSRELDSKKVSSQTPASCRSKSTTVCSFIAGSASSPKRTNPKTSGDEASSSGMSESNKKISEVVRKTKHYSRKTQHIPILESENISVDGTPNLGWPYKESPEEARFLKVNQFIALSSLFRIVADDPWSGYADRSHICKFVRLVRPVMTDSCYVRARGARLSQQKSFLMPPS
ncbi:hypothetical protein KY285_011171 [Solanum tuberosum]|nr:hypothetical protein KY289_011744 [Solanum tuberosum]KAH0735464.1 hypothetical protein KY285_011171 [Solanum tuberosum]